MQKALIAAGVIMLTMLAGCTAMEKFVGTDDVASSSQKASQSASSPFPALDAWLASHQVGVNSGQADRYDYDAAFSQGMVIAYGEGLPAVGMEGGQKRLAATRAAEVVAQRNLAEYFARKATNGEVRFKNYSMRLDAFLKGAVVAASDYNPELGKAAVLLKLDLRGATAFAK